MQVKNLQFYLEVFGQSHINLHLFIAWKYMCWECSQWILLTLLNLQVFYLVAKKRKNKNFNYGIEIPNGSVFIFVLSMGDI